MKLFLSLLFISLLGVWSFGAWSHDTKLNEHDSKLITHDKDSEQVRVAKLSFIWVTQITKGAQSIQKEEYSPKHVIGYRGNHYRFLGSEIIGNQDILRFEAHSAKTVNIELTLKGAAKLSTATANNIGKEMALLLDDEVVNIVTVQTKLGAKMMITGLTEEQVKYLLSGREN